MGRYFAIIVHYTSSASTTRLVQALAGSKGRPDFIIVIDHADIPHIASHDAGVVVHRQPNRGYAGGIHTGLQVITSLGGDEGDVVMCLNNDIEIPTSAMTEIRRWRKMQSQEFIAGCKVGWVNLVTGRAHLSAKIIPYVSKQYVHGSFIVAPLGTLRRIHLPLGLHMYWEDVAISWQVAAQDIPLFALPSLGISHNDVVGALSPDKKYYLVRNGAYVLETLTSLSWRMYWKIFNNARSIYHRMRGHRDVMRALEDRKKVSL